MLLIDSPDILEWFLKAWSGEFDWDQWNLEKLQKHDFVKENAEEALSVNFAFAGEVVGEWGERRFLICSKISDGRYVTLACAKSRTAENKIRVISCRRSRKNEKTIYNNHKK